MVISLDLAANQWKSETDYLNVLSLVIRLCISRHCYSLFKYYVTVVVDLLFR